MAKYQGAYRADVNVEDENTAAVEAENTEDETPQKPAGETWEQRYSDLRRYQQQEKQRLQQENEQLQRQLQDATKQQIRFPKTEEEIEAWRKKYPDVAGIIDTIATKKAQEALESRKGDFEEVTKLKAQIAQKEAYSELLRLHPDFEEIKSDPAFHDWVAEQPANIADALYKNNTDARAAAAAIDYYKAKTGFGKKRRNAPSASEAAEAVGNSGRRSGPAEGKGKKFSESMVERESKRDPAWFERNEAAISKAIRSGEFEYDLSGG